jgi:hypothetical protein
METTFCEIKKISLENTCRKKKTAKLLIMTKFCCFYFLLYRLSFESAWSQKSINFSFKSILSMLYLTFYQMKSEHGDGKPIFAAFRVIYSQIF